MAGSETPPVRSIIYSPSVNGLCSFSLILKNLISKKESHKYRGLFIFYFFTPSNVNKYIIVVMLRRWVKKRLCFSPAEDSFTFNSDFMSVCGKEVEEKRETADSSQNEIREKHPPALYESKVWIFCFEGKIRADLWKVLGKLLERG